ncbi:MAG: hypothetical protein WC003_01970 [Terrimicrobiaceae bacterium]
MRRKQSLGTGWLLIPLVLGLPIAVFLAWKDQGPPVPPGMPREVRSGGSGAAVADAVPGAGVRAEAPSEPLPAVEVDVRGTLPPKGIPDVAAVVLPEAPKPETSTASANENPPPPASPPVQDIDWAEIATRPARWPAQTRTKAPVDFPITVEGRRSGSTRVPAGASVKVVKILEDGVEIAFAEYSSKVAFDQTTLGEQVGSPPQDNRTAPRVTEPATPAPKAEPPAPPKSDGAFLAPQKKWKSPPGDGRSSLIELFKVLDHDSRPDDSLEVTEHPEIYRGVTLMMPLRDALVRLGLSLDLIPSRRAVSHPGIPLYFRAFPFKYSLVGEPDDHFNVLNIVTDAGDRVVALQFVCEDPHSKMYYPKEEFQTYDFLLERRKSSTALKAGCEVAPSSNEVLLIESWLFDARRDKCLEIVRLYMPKRVANFLRHVIETRLALAE